MKLTDIQVELLEEEKREISKLIGKGIDVTDANTRIMLIDSILANYETLTPKANDKENVVPGKEFSVLLDYSDNGDDTDKELFTGILVEEKPKSNSHLTSIESPLGKAINGQPIGSSFSYTVQKDFQVRGRILDANIPTIERAREIVKQK